MLTFGPIPSRRLGQSLGINNIPPKICTYSCSYCQQGFSQKMSVERREFYEPEKILAEVTARAKNVLDAGKVIDYLAFVPDGEPTLDINLGREISLLKKLGIPIAVITNASLLWRKDVRNDLLQADWVSVKVDTVDENIWRKIDHPVRSLSLDTVLKGIVAFAKEYRGTLVTETMLVRGLNDEKAALLPTAQFLAQIRPQKSYILVPTRPPADKNTYPPKEESINMAFQIFQGCLNSVECLIGYEGNNFAATGNPADDILGITAVHPMREDAVKDLLQRSQASWSIVSELLAKGDLVEVEHDGFRYYMRKLYDGYHR
ncbi:MAG: radical SAM protein [Syntrophomonadaceae bacterium]|jgi:wyosine [tRNA(Phe)-imidazoG37] synthetase (radical SAM superfamily)